MATRLVNLNRLCLLPTGLLTFTREGDASPKKWVFQRVGKNFGNISTRKKYDLQLRNHVIPFDPKTAPQLTQRSYMADAVAAWQILPVADRKAYNKRAGGGYRMSGYNLFIRDHIKNSILGV